MNIKENIILLLITRLARYSNILNREGILTDYQRKKIYNWCFTGTKKCERRFNDVTGKNRHDV